jgi:hypothetical protein
MNRLTLLAAVGTPAAPNIMITAATNPRDARRHRPVHEGGDLRIDRVPLVQQLRCTSYRLVGHNAKSSTSTSPLAALSCRR